MRPHGPPSEGRGRQPHAGARTKPGGPIVRPRRPSSATPATTPEPSALDLAVLNDSRTAVDQAGTLRATFTVNLSNTFGTATGVADIVAGTAISVKFHAVSWP
ncbi:hypothetical protein GCM10022255_078960 [Dactylosporangium darangshiense]|uniref:Uncharacterized protein n=1 Tax=Dactylosporangium darangshiense TaxID=579108 RepID=A0ABP8DLE2_9ACTN